MTLKQRLIDTLHSDTFTEKELRHLIYDLDTYDLWLNVCRDQILSEPFMREFRDRIYWAVVSERQILSESFIGQFAHHLNWRAISLCQCLSEQFIVTHQNAVDWDLIFVSQILSPEFIKKNQFRTRISRLKMLQYTLVEELGGMNVESPTGGNPVYGCTEGMDRVRLIMGEDCIEYNAFLLKLRAHTDSKLRSDVYSNLATYTRYYNESFDITIKGHNNNEV